jgi:hypothetical protein
MSIERKREVVPSSSPGPFVAVSAQRENGVLVKKFFCASGEEKRRMMI